MKSRIMRKVFVGNLFIFLLLLLLQLVFQTLSFEPFLAGEQKKRLRISMEAVQAAIQSNDEDAVRQKIKDGMNAGIVMVAVDQDMNQIYGQSFDQYQRCFTVEDQLGKQYSIVEDYLQSVPLQTIGVGDEVSIEGYLVDERHALVIPSKVRRQSDGVVLGTDTFLFINQDTETRGSTPADKGGAATASPDDGEKLAADVPAGGDGTGGNATDQEIASRGVAISGEGSVQYAPAEAENPATLSAGDTYQVGTAVTGASANGDVGENDLPTGFVLQTPFDISGNQESAERSCALSGSLPYSDLRAERMLIINSSERNGHSYPISIKGMVVDKVDLSNTDLIIQQGLITDEIKRLSASDGAATSKGAYTASYQLTTGKYVLYVSRIALRQTTLIGAISLYSVKNINGLMNAFHVLLFVTELTLLLFLLHFFSRVISKPLVEMNGVALKIARQDFSSKVNVTSQDEVGTLGLSINAISTNLEQRIQQIKAINDQLQMDYERQLALQQRHKQLSASFSHELKTPLTIVRGCIDGIQSGIYPQNQVEYYDVALRSLDNASNLVTQMLEIARMESPYFALKKTTFDLWMVFFKVYDELKQTRDQPEMQVQFSAEDEAITIADAELIERVITNALTNAIKYSPKGSKIAVRITTTQKEHTFAIVNENSHIPPEELENIWLPFYRVKKPVEGATGGTGLGLMIVREILSAHGFAFGIQNTENGVEFHFSCPALVLPTV